MFGKPETELRIIAYIIFITGLVAGIYVALAINGWTGIGIMFGSYLFGVLLCAFAKLLDNTRMSDRSKTDLEDIKIQSEQKVYADPHAYAETHAYAEPHASREEIERDPESSRKA